MTGVCKRCCRGTFGRLCGACKGEAAAVRRRVAEQNAMTEAFKEGALAALSGGRRHLDNPYKWEGRHEWFKGFDKAVVQLETLRNQYQ